MKNKVLEAKKKYNFLNFKKLDCDNFIAKAIAINNKKITVTCRH